MVSRILRHARTNAVAYLALSVALGGTSYAAIKLPANSVGSKQIKKSAVTRAKLKANAVNSSKVANGSLLAADFQAGQIPAGPAGPAGPQGPKGDPGDPASVANGSVGPSKLATVPGARATRYLSAQSIPNNTETKLQFTHEERDSDGMLDIAASNTAFTINTPGLYLLEASMSWQSDNAGRRTASFRINDLGYAGLVSQQSVQGDSTWQSITRVERLAAGDVVELIAYQNSGNSVNTDNYEGIAPQMTVQWLSP